jgi:hypothetical protein
MVSFLGVRRRVLKTFERRVRLEREATADIIRLIWWVFSLFFTIASLEFGSLHSQNYTDVD